MMRNKKNKIRINLPSRINLNNLKIIFFLASISYFICISIINFENIDLQLEIRNSRIFLSFGFCLLSILFNGLAWKYIVEWLGLKSNFKDLTSFYILTNSLKYIPGGIWHFIERFNFLRLRTNKNLAITAILIEPYLMIASALLIGSIGLIYNFQLILLIIPAFLLNKNTIFSLVVIFARIKNKSIKFLKLTKSKNEFDSHIDIKNFFPLKSFILEVLFIIFKFCGFISCLDIVSFEDYINLINIFVVFCLSWSIGLVIPAAPGGIGIFEACFLFLLGNNLPQYMIIEGLIYFRFICIFSDLFLSSPLLLKKLIEKF